MALPKFVSFWVGFLAFLWPQVAKKHGVSKIRAGGRAESALSFLCKVWRRKDSLPFLREKIDSGVFCGITSQFYPYRSMGLFLFFFFLNKVIYKNKLQLAHTGACTKLKENTCNSQCTIFQFNNKHIPEHVQS